MIISIRNRQLKALHKKRTVRRIPPTSLKRLKAILAFLDSVEGPAELRRHALSWQVHPLKGKYKGYYAISVSGNWRIIFRFEGEDVADLDYLDYH